MSSPKSSINGFTLIEMAIVLVIVGLLVAMGAAMIGPLSNMARVKETKDTLDADSQAITSWASANNRLPDTTSLPVTNPVLFNNVAKTPNDAWGRPVVYLYDSAFTNGTITKDTICGRRAAALTVTTVSPPATVTNVAFVLLSGAGNPTPQSTLGGAPIAGSGAANGTIAQDPAVNDILRWVTLDELRSKVGCQGAPLKIVNNELPPGTVGAAYPSPTVGSALSFAVDGGATPGIFRWCIETAAASALPGGLVFSAAVPTQVVPGASCGGLPEANWASAATLSFSGTPLPNTQGSYSFTVYVRDNSDATGPNDNIASKAFVLTINP